MTNDIKLLEIMEKTITTLKKNKDTVIEIVSDLQTEYDEKKRELKEIKDKLPDVMLECINLRKLDKQMRQNLIVASTDFSAEGHQNLRRVFEKANTVHTQMIKAEELEQSYISRRDQLEIQLKKARLNIEHAEAMAHQLIASLSYLQVGINDVNSRLIPKSSADSNSVYTASLAAFKCIEDEKSRIARDLHDGPMQQIASVQMRIDFCKTAVELDLKKGLLLVENLKQDLSSTLSEVRAILFDLNPAPLDKLGLKACIEHMLCNITDKMHINLSFTYKLEHLTLDLPTQTTIYRIIQELLNNIKKHANASDVIIQLSEFNNFILITVEDNGIGFSVPEDFELFRTQNKSYGLSNIYTRIHNSNGNLKVSSHPDTGSSFRIELPILSS